MRSVTESLTKEYRLWLSLASQHGHELTPAEETILTTEPTATQNMMRWLMGLDNQQEAKPTVPEAKEKLESIFQDRRSLLQTALESTDSESSPAMANSKDSPNQAAHLVLRSERTE